MSQQLDAFAALEEQGTPPSQPAHAYPFRTAVHTRTDQEIALLNAEHGYRGARAYEGVEAALARIRTARSASEDRLESWVTHPDERVVIEALKHGWAGNWPLSQQRAGEKLLRSALADADAAGVQWTRALDAYEVATGAGWAGKRIHALGQWVEEQADPAEVVRLLEFESAAVQRVVFSRARVFSDGMLGAVFNGRSINGTLLSGLGENPAADAGTHGRVLELAWRLDIDEVDPIGLYRGYGGARSDVLMEWMLGRGVPIPPSFRAELLSLALNEGGEEGMDPERREGRRAVAGAILAGGTLRQRGPSKEQLLAVGGFSGDELLAYLQRLPDAWRNTAMIGALIRHPLATAEVWRSIAGMTLASPENAARAFAAQPASLEMPEVRQYILTHAAAYRLEEALCYDGRGTLLSPSEYRLLFRRVANECGNYFIASIVESATPEHRAALTPDDWSSMADPNSRPRLNLQTLSLIPSARNTPDIRKRMRVSKNPRVLHGLLADAPPQDVRKLFRRLASANPLAALELLEDKNWSRAAELKPGDLQPLLVSQDSSIRKRAIIAVGTVRSAALAARRDRTEDAPSAPQPLRV
jgi:hypothetical protein